MDESHPNASDELAEYMPQLRRLAMDLVGPQDVEDILQETIYRCLRNIRSAGKMTLAYVKTALRNEAARMRTTRGRRRDRDAQYAQLHSQAQSTSSALDEYERRELFSKLRDAISKLSEPHQTVIRLSYFLGFSSQQIARRLRINPTTARSHLYRAKEELRQRLDVDCGGRTVWQGAFALMLRQPLPGSDGAGALTRTGGGGKWLVLGGSIVITVGLGTAFLNRQPHTFDSLLEPAAMGEGDLGLADPLVFNDAEIVEDGGSGRIQAPRGLGFGDLDSAGATAASLDIGEPLAPVPELTTLVVRSILTLEELHGVQIVRSAMHGPPHPGVVREEDFVVSSADSPVLLLPDDPSQGFAYYWIRAAGHAWKRLKVNHATPGERFIHLEAEGILAVEFDNVGSGPFPDFVLHRVDFETPYLRIPLDNAERLLISGIPPDPYVAKVVQGAKKPRATARGDHLFLTQGAGITLAQGEVEVRTGPPTEVHLLLTNIERPPRAASRIEIDLPPEARSVPITLCLYPTSEIDRREFPEGVTLSLQPALGSNAPLGVPLPELPETEWELILKPFLFREIVSLDSRAPISVRVPALATLSVHVNEQLEIEMLKAVAWLEDYHTPLALQATVNPSTRIWQVLLVPGSYRLTGVTPGVLRPESEGMRVEVAAGFQDIGEFRPSERSEPKTTYALRVEFLDGTTPIPIEHLPFKFQAVYPGTEVNSVPPYFAPADAPGPVTYGGHAPAPDAAHNDVFVGDPGSYWAPSFQLDGYQPIEGRTVHVVGPGITLVTYRLARAP